MVKLADKKAAGKSAKKIKAPRQRRTARPELLPYPEYPLFPHRNGRWAKKIRGKLFYFGKLDDPEGALERYKAQIDDLQAGRTPRTTPDGLTVRGLVNHFLTVKRHRVETHELSARTFADYFSTCERVVKVFGKNRLVVDLASEDFEKLRKDIAKTRGAVSLGNEVQRVRTLFGFAFHNELVDKPVRFGSEFKRPAKKVLRKARQAKGRRMLAAGDLRRLIAEASQPLKAMIYLGLNCGFGNNDVGLLPLAAVDLDKGWVEYPRPKTAVERRAPLWPETVAALREWLKVRPTPKSDDAKDLVFITKYGASWSKLPRLGQDENGKLVEAFVDNPVSKEFRKLLDTLKVHRPGVGFYTLRHVFETVAGGSRDQVAVDHVMGHVDPSMAAEYREHIEDERLLAVVNHVRGWLLANGRAADEKMPEGGWTIEPALSQ